MDSQSNEHSIEFLFDQIESMDTQALSDIMDAVRDRYAFLHPDWEILYLALPKGDTALRTQLLKSACEKINLLP